MNSIILNSTVLLVGHGSRNSEGNHEIDRFATHWHEQNADWHIETCFIEFAEVLLDAGLDNAAKHAASHNQKVIVVPLILNAAGHVKMEIPHFIDAARTRHPEVEFIYARHLGAGEAILTIIKRELCNVMEALDVPDPKTTGVIILGRGSSDRVANGEVAKMARWLYEENDHEQIDIAFTGITYPRLERVVQQQVALGITQIAILPYYLFTGTLIERIKRQVARLQAQYPQLAIQCGNYFGFEKEIYALLTLRVLQANGSTHETDATMMECDGCQYRLLAEESDEHLHHHHSEPESADKVDT
ncbi:Sirohydrochlorin cobaltochelatase CbiX(long) [hydrothermal vent metagenome]|uniref:Sirohydrochlorin cobaltochelatase CbiX(Long) n=1 Tax=hydrothermal vent metagenome TaxID=652676 RepID=A0A3B1B1X9_9ZZZZ